MINNLKKCLGSPRILFLITSILLLPASLFSQPLKADTIRLKENLLFLSSDYLKGRAPGTTEDSLAASFISDKLISAGFSPMIGNSLMVPFDFIIHREVQKNSFISISGKNLMYDLDYFISPISPSAQITGEIEAIDKISNGLVSRKGKIALIKSDPDSVQFITTPLSQQGYEGVLFYNENKINPLKNVRSSGVSIPVVGISKELASFILSEKSLICNIESRVDIVKGRSFNVLAVKPGSDKRSYILAGAHFDHLGFGGKGSGSMYKNEGEIHNGADDNGSGVVSVIEIGRVLSASIDNNPHSNHSYGIAIAAFGAEERGLIGSRIVADTLASLKLLPALMINLDMVGRMNDRRVQAGGAGTFLGADSILLSVNKNYNLNLTVTKDGYGPSDHASFYTKGVPVLYFTTGVHKEYHTPLDDYDLINFDGIRVITDFISDIVHNISETGFVPQYQKSDAPVSSARRSFKVTLGVIPDFTYEKGDGFRVGSVTDGRPAQIAGMKEGDIIINMNEKKINNIYDYMSALDGLKQGSQVQVIIRRELTEITLYIVL